MYEKVSLWIIAAALVFGSISFGIAMVRQYHDDCGTRFNAQGYPDAKGPYCTKDLYYKDKAWTPHHFH